MKPITLIAGIAVGVLAACATTPVEGPYPDTIMPRCTAGPDCAAKWLAAKDFVEQNSQMKISISTDVRIETDTPPPYTGNIGMTVTKEPAGAGTYKLKAAAYCGSNRCLKEPWMIVAAFNLKLANQ